MEPNVFIHVWLYPVVDIDRGRVCIVLNLRWLDIVITKTLLKNRELKPGDHFYAQVAETD
jgi:hypothetical protein